MAKVKNKYMFPDILAKAMSKVDMRTQLEASMMSMSLMLVGMLITVFYFAVFYDFPTWYRVTLVINGLAGLVFLTSFIITTFQQYQSYLSAIEFQNELKLKGGSNKNAKKD